MRLRAILVVGALIVIAAAAAAVFLGGGVPGLTVNEGQTLRIVSGSENESLEPLIQDWARRNGYNIEITYMGSLDIGRMLRTGSSQFDAVWPANTLWLFWGDTNNIVSGEQSIMRSPVVFGVKRSVAERLGWTDGAEVYMEDILNATESGEVRFMMTSATQSNSGASFYFAALSAFSDSPEVLTSDDLADPQVQQQITRILGTVDRSSGSSGWLLDLFLEEYDRFDAMVNYEALIIEANQELERTGREPLYAIYPVDGLAIADSPLGFIDRGIEGKEEIFNDLMEFLLSDETQADLIQFGRRASLVGLSLDNANTSAFRPEWGIDIDRVIQPIRFPNATVIQEGLELYQTAFRRPSCTIYVLDYSGSMDGNGERDLELAMRTLLHQPTASQYLLQGHPGDVSTIILFNDGIINRNDLDQWTVRGNDEDVLLNLYTQIERTRPGGGTNIFGAAERALRHMEEIRTTECLPAVILMTDGQDNAGSFSNLSNYVNRTENDVPVFAITFGSASEDQLAQITRLTRARIFDGTEDLIAAFRSAKGYN